MMDDQGDLYFSFDDEDAGLEETSFETPTPGDEPPQKETPKNRTFLIAVIALALISLLGIGLLAAFYFWGDGFDRQVSDNELTNQANMTLFAVTQTAEFEASLEPTDIFIEEEEGEGAAATETSEESAGAVEPTKVSQAESPTDVAPAATSTGSSIIIDVTPLDSEAEEGAAVGSEGAEGEESGAPTAQPTLAPVATLPDTGLFDSNNFGGIALIAVAFVAIIVVARKLRTR